MVGLTPSAHSRVTAMFTIQKDAEGVKTPGDGPLRAQLSVERCFSLCRLAESPLAVWKCGCSTGG